MRLYTRFFVSMSSLLGLLILWELSGRLIGPNLNVFPPPSQFMSRIFDTDFQIGLGSQATTLYASIVSSVARVFAGLVVAFLFAMLAGVVISSRVTMRLLFLPIIQLFAPIAPIAWIPIALILFGVGDSTAIFIVFMGVFFIFTIGVVRAVETVPEDILNAARILGTSGWKTWRYVILPYILPSLFTMLRINFIAAWMAVLAAEMTGLRDGLGAIIMIGRNLFDYDLILLGMTLIGVIGFIFDQFLLEVQRRLLWWESK